MIFMIIISNKSTIIKQNYYSQYQDFFYDNNKFDNSDYPENSKFYDKTNKKIIGKFKDETSSIPITEFIGLRSKCIHISKIIIKIIKQQK